MVATSNITFHQNIVVFLDFDTQVFPINMCFPYPLYKLPTPFDVLKTFCVARKHNNIVLRHTQQKDYIMVNVFDTDEARVIMVIGWGRRSEMKLKEMEEWKTFCALSEKYSPSALLIHKDLTSAN